MVKGRAATTTPSAVTDGADVDLRLTSTGALVVATSTGADIGGLARASKGDTHSTITASTTEATIIANGGAGVLLDVYGLIITNSSATACTVSIKDATAGTTRATIHVPAGDTRGFMVDPTGALKQATANNNWTATCSASVSSIFITALYTIN